MLLQFFELVLLEASVSSYKNSQ
uniref:Uncharacterized protein n=1 Tax=Arundo donax TaxID=35708 RepID=A0A0A9AGM2_ARUDO